MVRKLFLFVAILTVTVTVTVYGYTDWQRVGPGGGGNIVDVICHPTDPDIVWVETDLTGIFKSTDGGKNFRRISGPIERKEVFFEWMRGLDHELVYDLSDPDIMYWAMDGGIYTTPGLYKSTDGGESWFKLLGSPNLSPASIVVDYNGVIYGIKHRNMYVSFDKGETWITKPDVPTYYNGNDYSWRRNHRIFIYLTRGNKIVIGDRREGTGIFVSDNQGDSWNNLLKGEEILDVACSPVTPGFIMAFEQDGRIFRSENSGENFEVVEQIEHSYYHWGNWPTHWGGIAINKCDNVMAVGRTSLGVSSDGGLNFQVYMEEDCTWNPGDYIFPNRGTNRNLFKCNKLAASSASGTWFFVDGVVVKKSVDNGASWTGVCNGIDILCVYSPPVVEKNNPNIIHVGAGDNGHYYTKDSGQTWSTSEDDMGSIEAIAQDPNNSLVMYKMYGRYSKKCVIAKSIDGGLNWDIISDIPASFDRSELDSTFYNGWCGRMSVDPTNSNRVYACHRATDGLYMSEDAGKTFKRVIELFHPWQLEVTNKGTVFICTWDSKGLYRSIDYGKSFVQINNGKVHDFAIHPEDENIIYVNAGSFDNAWASANFVNPYEKGRDHGKGEKGKLFKTVDGGESWNLLGAYDGFALFIEPNYPDVMLMSTREGGNGIMRSMDAGETWTSIHNNHNNYHPRGFVYGGVPGRVYTWNHNLERIDDIHIEKLQKKATR